MNFVSNMSAAELDEFSAKNAQGRYLQSLEQFDLLKKQGRDVGCVGVTDNSGNIAAAALYTRDTVRAGGYVYSIKGGPLLDYDDDQLVKFFFSHMEDFFKKNNGFSVRIAPTFDSGIYDDNGDTNESCGEDKIRLLKRLGYYHSPTTKVLNNIYPQAGLGYEYRKKLYGIDNEGSLFKSYAIAGKRNLKKAIRFGVKVRKLKRSELPVFKKYMQNTAERRDFSDKSLEFYKNVYDAYGENAMFLVSELDLEECQRNLEASLEEVNKKYVAVEKGIAQHPGSKAKSFINKANQLKQQMKASQRKLEIVQRVHKQYDSNNIILSGGMFLIHPKEVGYIFGFMDNNLNVFDGPYAVQDYAMKVAIKKGVPMYNFYMVTGKFDGSDGVLRFKQSFNGKTYRTVGLFEKPLKPISWRIDHIIKKLLKREVK